MAFIPKQTLPFSASTKGANEAENSIWTRRSPFSSRGRILLRNFSPTSSVFSSSSYGTCVSTSSSFAEKNGPIKDNFCDAKVRRISFPLQRVKNSATVRRLSNFVQRIGDADQQKLLNFNGEKPSDQFGNLNREWEVVTVRELCRRLSLEDSLDATEMPLPEGSDQSQMLDEFMIKQIVELLLPPRAEGYPWIQIYSSEKHGFSLTTLYRKMAEWNEEMSPVLMVIRDVGGHVFGAVASTALKPCDHYYGTGDSSLLFRFTGEFPHTRELRTYTWTGDNQFFVNATRDSLSFGAGGGHYGLWLDADLNHGRSQKCATFDNEPLAGGMEEDFVVQFVEVFGFSMT